MERKVYSMFYVGKSFLQIIHILIRRKQKVNLNLFSAWLNSRQRQQWNIMKPIDYENPGHFGRSENAK